MVRSVSPKPPLDPRKSPAQARSIETVRVILEAAARILEARGFEGYTTNAVAERAGVSVGSLYQYFPGKDALTVALIGEETALLVQALATARQMASGREALSLLIGAAVAHQMRRPVLARLLDEAERRLPPVERETLLRRQAVDVLTAVMGRPDLPAQPNPGSAAEDVLVIVTALTDAAGMRGETDAGPLAARIAAAVFGYLGLRRP